jgi:nitrogen fixation NifU-like protein
MDTRELYQQVILDHNRAPRNFKALEDANREANGHNPLCGDTLKLFLKVDGDTIADVGFLGSGCAISKASSSMMTAAVKGKTVADADELFDRFHAMVTGVEEPDKAVLGRLVALNGVKAFPARVKCASLAWHTLKAALRNDPSGASTE